MLKKKVNGGNEPNNQMVNNLQMPRYKEITVKGRPVKLKYCFTVNSISILFIISLKRILM